VVLYAGTFETYQGVDLMLEAVQRARETVPDLRFVLAGGNPQQIEAAKEHARSLGISQNVEFRGPQSPRTISRWMREADVLLTARTSGTNTPLKIYSYLSSGTPILATDIYSHRQVLNDDVSVLVKPEPEALADGLIRLWRDTGLRKRLSLNALAYFRENYSYERYVEAVDRIVQQALEHARQRRTGGSNA
ncbi:MAG TPA: glycosyltransferase, partial [Bacteroidetes bacterium]|nr:glycosyltransferase [Bacteroidota bacterium]